MTGISPSNRQLKESDEKLYSALGEYFNTRAKCRQLAICLLPETPGGPTEFIDSKRGRGESMSWNEVAENVLKEWVKHNGENATKAVLFEKLKKELFHAAAEKLQSLP